MTVLYSLWLWGGGFSKVWHVYHSATTLPQSINCFMAQYPHANFLYWFPWIKNELRELDKRSKHSPFDDHFKNSLNLFFWLCNDKVRRKSMLFTLDWDKKGLHYTKIWKAGNISFYIFPTFCSDLKFLKMYSNCMCENQWQIIWSSIFLVLVLGASYWASCLRDRHTGLQWRACPSWYKNCCICGQPGWRGRFWRRETKKKEKTTSCQVQKVCKTPLTGFSISFKVDNYDVNVGGLVAACCRQFQAFILSLYPTCISSKSRWLKPPSSKVSVFWDFT